jgi:hypothetical protein
VFYVELLLVTDTSTLGLVIGGAAVGDGYIHSRVGDRSKRVFRRSLDFGKYRAVLLHLKEYEILS